MKANLLILAVFCLSIQDGYSETERCSENLHSAITDGISGENSLCDVSAVDSISRFPPPPVSNDECANAILLTPDNTCNPVPGTTIGGTSSATAYPCINNNIAENDVWYKFVATSTHATVQVDFADGLAGQLDLRSGPCNGTSFECAESGAFGIALLSATTLTVGNTYYISVFTEGGAGDFSVCVIGPPANDHCSGAFSLTPSTTCNPVDGTLSNASASGVSPCIFAGDEDVWYKFVADAANVTVTVNYPVGIPSYINLRSGACNGASIDCASSTSSVCSLSASGLTVGATYLVLMGTSGGIQPFTICVTSCVVTTFNVTGGGTFCPGGSLLPVGLSGSEDGVSYQLKRNGSDVGAPVIGDGSAITFGSFNTAGNYTVTATKDCGSIGMNGSVDLTIGTNHTYYFDNDGDGYHGNSQVTCIDPGNGWTTTTSGPDCNDNSSLVQVESTWFYDGDGDYYHGSTLVSCNSPGAGWIDITNGPDCNDDNAAVNPGATETCGNFVDDNCDGIVDEGCCNIPGGLFATNITSGSANLNWIAVPAANEYKVQYKRTKVEDTWIPVKTDTNSKTITGLASSTEYKWKVRSLCTDEKSVFSPNVKFITTPAKEGDEMIPQNELLIYPNPAAQSFTIRLSLDKTENVQPVIEVINILGQVVYAMTCNAYHDNLDCHVNPEPQLQEGSYLIRVIAGSEIYTSRLVVQ